MYLHHNIFSFNCNITIVFIFSQKPNLPPISVTFLRAIISEVKVRYHFEFLLQFFDKAFRGRV